MTDDVLVTRVAGGDTTAFWLLYERHRGVVFRFAYGLLGATEAAEDVTHDTFVALMVEPRKFDPSRASLRTYLCAIARNRARTQRRRSTSEVAWNPDAHETSAPPHDGPLATALDRELAEQVQRAVARLRPLLREVLVLVDYEGFSLAETATIVGARVGTVKMRLHRARTAMRDALADYLEPSSRPQRQRSES